MSVSAGNMSKEHKYEYYLIIKLQKVNIFSRKLMENIEICIFQHSYALSKF